VVDGAPELIAGTFVDDDESVVELRGTSHLDSAPLLLQLAECQLEVAFQVFREHSDFHRRIKACKHVEQVFVDVGIDDQDFLLALTDDVFYRSVGGVHFTLGDEYFLSTYDFPSIAAAPLSVTLTQLSRTTRSLPVGVISRSLRRSPQIQMSVSFSSSSPHVRSVPERRTCDRIHSPRRKRTDRDRWDARRALTTSIPGTSFKSICRVLILSHLFAPLVGHC
jgi:hypothetical protein